MATITYAVQNSRREQMKRELIGLVIGTTLLMAGMAFLFSQTLVADGASSTSAANEAAKPEPVVAASAPIVAAVPSVAPAPSVMADTTSSAISKADIPVLASLDVSTENAAVTPDKVPEVSAEVITEAKVEASTAPENTPPVAAATPTGSTGWIYAGQFVSGKWTEQGLKIGAELPVVGNKYPLSWGATVRDYPPGKRSSGDSKLGKTVGNLAPGREVDVVQVKKSGSKGHVWLEIRYQ